MDLNDTFVVLDTCVLLMPRVSDVLMDLRAEKLFSAHWTVNIDDEFLRNLHKVYGIPLNQAQNRLRAMKARCPEWEVFMSTEDFAAVPGDVDRKDRHVAAAALALRHAADKDAEEDEAGRTYRVILVSENIKDMAEKHMAMLGVRVMCTGEFLNAVYEADPEAAKRAVCQAAKDLRKPPYTVAELLHVLRQIGAKTLVSRMSKDLGITPVQKEKPPER
ncbi:PIN domain-containing protein [Ralstonia pseudosolanacearum]|uniref:PIN domain-containing protein n=1 Tax=Ralstonia pseudosolanacearum TaxID=1310165 RepID=UPI001FF7149D|nr:PIN domain-containing protein [Ralstonia pseudosolanacearum]